MLTRRRKANSTSDNDPAVYVLPTTQPNRRVDDEAKGSYGNHGNISVANGNYNLQSLNRGPNFSIDSVSNCQDRTQEFMSVIKSAQARKNIPILNQKQALRQSNEFAIIAKKIGKDITNTFEKLQKLTFLVGRKSSSDLAATHDTVQLTNFIRQDLTVLNKQIAQLQQLLKAQRIQNGGRHKLAHSNSIIVALQSKLVTISTEFKFVLEVRNEDLRKENCQQSMHHSSSKSALLDNCPNDRRQLTGIDLVIDMDDGDTSRRHQQHRQQQATRQKIFIDDRSDTMTEIEQTIVELGGIFQQLATMVKEQEEIVQRIDSNIEDTQLNIEVAHGEILKYFHSVSSSRSLMIKIFIVLIILFVVLVVVLT